MKMANADDATFARFGSCAGSENSLRAALVELFRHNAALKICFALFSQRTTMYYLDRGLRFGVATYISTGRNYDAITSNFTVVYSLYARSHFCYGVELIGMAKANQWKIMLGSNPASTK